MLPTDVPATTGSAGRPPQVDIPRRFVAGVTVAAVLIAGSVFGTGGASARVAGPTPRAISTPTLYPYTGERQGVQAPAGTYGAIVTASGGSGGYGSDSTVQPGYGAQLSAVVATTPGQTLQLSVGQAGSPNGTSGPGWGDTAPGGAGWKGAGSVGSSGGGGGATTVALDGQTMLVAGGGGGAGASWALGNLPGGAGGSGAFAPGNGASTSCSGQNGSAKAQGGLGGGAVGTVGLDGANNQSVPSGGGGGGGVRGGTGGGLIPGGGNCGAGGGGGGAGQSSISAAAFLPSTGTAVQRGSGLVTVQWLSSPLGLTIAGFAPTEPAGTTIPLAVQLTSGNTGLGNVTGQVFWSLSDSSDVLTPDGHLTVRAAGSHTVTASLGAYSTQATFTVQAGPATGPATLSAPAGATVGSASTFVLAAYDQYGNIVQNLSDQAVLTSDNPPDVIAGDTITFANPAGTRTITAAANGNNYQSHVAVVSNEAPVCQPQTVQVLEDTSVFVDPAGSDCTNGPFTDSQATQPQHGTVTAVPQSTGTVYRYQPVASYSGPDSFTLQITNTAGLVSNAALISVSVTSDVPVCQPQSVQVLEGQSLVVDPADSNCTNGPFTGTQASQPQHGTVTPVKQSSGTVYRYQPAAGYSGSDSFTLQLTNAAGLISNAALISITVTSDVPVCQPQSVQVFENSSVLVDANASDCTNGPFTIDQVGLASNGTAKFVQQSSGVSVIQYTPNPGYVGNDTFTLQRTNAGGYQSNAATISVTVVGVPVCQPFSLQVTADRNVSQPIADVSCTNGPVINALIGDPQHGTTALVGGPGGELVQYTPTPGYTGPDSFTMKLGTAVGAWSNQITVDVQVSLSTLGASNDNGAFSVRATLTNKTGVPLTLDPSKSNVDGGNGHWMQRPQHTLANGQSVTVSGYTLDPSGMNLTVVYTMPNGEYAYFIANNTLFSANFIADGVTRQWSDGPGPIDTAYTHNVGTIGKGVHPTANMTISNVAPTKVRTPVATWGHRLTTEIATLGKSGTPGR